MQESSGCKPCCTPKREGSVSASGQTREVLQRETTSIEGMVRLDGGRFLMGGEGPETWTADGEGPVREVEVSPFAIGASAVTNAEFAEFVDATGYRTDSERFGWSFVFHLHVSKKRREKLRKDRAVQNLEWWLAVPGAHWRDPEGNRAAIDDRLKHPVVHVSWADAEAYCRWSGTRLPTEAEWEFAARGGLEQRIYPWGDTFRPNGQWRANIFQGRFPENDTGADGFKGTAPADYYPPNDYGLCNCVGNVWEWCSDWFSPDHHVRHPEERLNPTGPKTGDRRVQRGGSFLCHDSYCNRYRISARIGNTPDSATANLGFRCAADL